MQRIYIYFAVLLVALFACKQNKQAEEWSKKDAIHWPHISVTNEVTFGDTGYTQLGNSFFVNTGLDTVAVSSKHLFSVFQKYQGFDSVSLGPEFTHWCVYAKDNPYEQVEMLGVMNENCEEKICSEQLLQNDWIVFETPDELGNYYPLKIRRTPLKEKEVVYAYGWNTLPNIDMTKLVLAKMRVCGLEGEIVFTDTIDINGTHIGMSGAPVLDKDGYLVGIVSGMSEDDKNMISSVNCLLELFETYHIPYIKES